ncbi:hypothetical protein LEP1GSC103_2751 [Leptospira borgpetersenii serovar Javanica str. UI 09931]|uniref:Uncharacterized protein n=5 Tax=Leptospira borgpetersenii TaxID=174 RepID=M3HN60_LEPBO|nr:hypothetical protein LEP1GSC128_3392 [Leptospira borgpetersenii str. 200801926]EKQ92087.1 hypothetical protein LEP1GSC101_3096 [Leptospira borgpetersenii str. UI 09149]EMF99495.1 hypothetical protein LEP1GSC123_4743 [Leptospira borgpetersenii str. 200701203]EMK13218.1 hypothetical protein LEP1GSC066_3846 [Leptospira sp. serovar Kenya str. Sh9]EMN13491.1 hypothetical protein LEP1GSC055_3940 [Leptospira borgpetersenii str. Brem 307]EMN17529.1 hypothetical protein LEP1GSC056_3006 [Leptospira b
MNCPLPGTSNTLNFQDELSGRLKSGSKRGKLEPGKILRPR